MVSPEEHGLEEEGRFTDTEDASATAQVSLRSRSKKISSFGQGLQLISKQNTQLKESTLVAAEGSSNLEARTATSRQ